MEKGLSASLALERQKQFGKNEITSSTKSSLFIIFLSQFPSILNGILAAAGLFAFVIGDYIDGAFIFAILIINGIVGFIQEYKAEKSLEKLKELITPLTRVVRDGKETQIPTIDIVVDDIVVLAEGDRVPADGKVIQSHHIEIDESILTGESIPVIKQEKDEVFGGTLVSRGKAHVRITHIGMQTQFGKIAESLATIEVDKTPLQKRLDTLGKVLSFIALGVAVLLVPIGLYHQTEAFPLILLAISIGVAAVPEGLPAIITIALAIGTTRMARKHAIIRKLPSVETLGSVQVILMDKTGTLTQNKMSVKKYWTQNIKDLPLLHKACVLGNTATIIEKGNGQLGVIGDKTDGALISWVSSQVKDLETLKTDGKILDEYVFDPLTKTVAVIWEKDQKKHVFVRGAPEEVLAKSRINTTMRKKINSLIEDYAKQGFRVIGFGTKIESHSPDTLKRSHLENNLTFLGIVGIYDPPREEAKQAILSAKIAGIHPIMVTGDNPLTALTIAKEVGLLEKNENVITGDELKKLTDEQLKQIILETRVFARAKPEDKLRLTTLLQQMGYVVGVTGDGVNDALALKKADVGIAMGEEGTDVAKEAADIVLTDDNFATIVSAVEEGRTIYNNIVKSVKYLLSGNLAEVSLVFFSSLLGMPSPLLPTQILWINLVTDGLPSLALASDSKDPTVLKDKPRHPQSPILSNQTLLFIGAVGIGLSLMLLFVFSQLLKGGNETFARTITFNLLVFFHVMIAFFVRGGSIFRMNKMLVGSVILTFIIQIIISITPFFQRFLHLGF